MSSRVSDIDAAREAARAKTMNEVTKPDLTKEDLEALERAEKFIAERAKIPLSQRHPITNPDKYNFPIGMDDDGNFFPNPQEERRKR